LGAAFLPVVFTVVVPLGPAAPAAGVAALVGTAALLALGTAIVFPFEMDTIVALAGDRLVATHYGLYNTLCGVGIMLGNLGTGWAFDVAAAHGAAALPWLALITIGVGGAVAVHGLRARQLLPAER